MNFILLRYNESFHSYFPRDKNIIQKIFFEFYIKSNFKNKNPLFNNYDRFYFFAKFYAIISLRRLPNQCPKKSNHDFKEKYPYVWVGTLEPMRIKDILTKNHFF